MASHTPGPWVIGELRMKYDIVIRGAKSEPIALTQISGYTREEGIANARLIATAPDLLAALKIAVEWAKPMEDAPKDSRPKWFSNAKSVISRAEGK